MVPQLSEVWVRKQLIPVYAYGGSLGEVTELNPTIKPTNRSVLGGFAKEISSVEELNAIVAKFASAIATKLRAKGVAPSTHNISTHKSSPPRSPTTLRGGTIRFATPTDSTIEIATAASASYDVSSKRGMATKAFDMSRANAMQHLDGQPIRSLSTHKHQELMQVIDTINANHGGALLHLGAETFSRCRTQPSRQATLPAKGYSVDWVVATTIYSRSLSASKISPRPLW